MSIVNTRKDAFVMIVSLNRPARRNALSYDLLTALERALQAADDDTDTRAIVLTGEGPTFCAGGDLDGGMMGGGALLDGEHQRRIFSRLLAMVPAMRKPVIAAVQGDALGGGLGLAAVCDLVVIDPSARVGTPEVRVGLFPLVITAVLQQLVPQKALFEMAMLGRVVDAQQALAWGIVNKISGPGQSLVEALQWAHRLAGQSSAVVQLGKSALRLAKDLPYDKALDVLNGRLTVNLMLEDAAEGVGAFVDKRQPVWKDR